LKIPVHLVYGLWLESLSCFTLVVIQLDNYEKTLSQVDFYEAVLLSAELDREGGSRSESISNRGVDGLSLEQLYEVRLISSKIIETINAILNQCPNHSP
jgi:hypothetical protein